MIDITTKLRSGEHGWLPGLSCDAAAEIDRLRAEVSRLTEANRYLIGISNEAMEDARKYEEARLEIARLREALSKIAAYPRERSDEMGVAVLRQLSRAALAPAAGVS